jgi:ubiquinone/menaquinone biosynthesis C-methylase UbiE
VKEPRVEQHYSYRVYADPATARTFDDRRFGGPIGELIASDQAGVLATFVGRIDGRTILDVGTGTGRVALFLAKGGAKVTALDASREMLAVARKRAAGESVNVRFVSGDAHALEFGDRSFDVAVSLRVLMHAPRWRVCVSELCRVADRLVIVDYPSRRGFAAVEAAARRVLVRFSRQTEPYRVFADEEIADAFEDAGFRIRSVHRQFVLPIAFHKLLGSRRLTAVLEGALGRAGLLTRFGSPVTVVAERCGIS